MARTTNPLTNTEVKQAKPKDKEYSLVDGGGLALRIKPNRSKLWIFNYYRPYTKKRANISFGTFPDVSLADARLKRQEARMLLGQDIDPKEYRDETARRQRQTHNNTLEHIAAQWFEVKKNTVTVDYSVDIWSSFKLHIFPTLGKLPLHKLTAPKAIEVLEPVAAKGSLETVKRLCHEQGTNIWYDEGISAGKVWRRELAEAIQRHRSSSTTPEARPIEPREMGDVVAILPRRRAATSLLAGIPKGCLRPDFA